MHKGRPTRRRGGGHEDPVSVVVGASSVGLDLGSEEEIVYFVCYRWWAKVPLVTD